MSPSTRPGPMPCSGRRSLCARCRNPIGRPFATTSPVMIARRTPTNGRTPHAANSASSSTSRKQPKVQLPEARPLPSDTGNEEGDVTDEDVIAEYFTRMQAGHVMPSNVSFFAFTTTPKAETMTLFGRTGDKLDSKGQHIPVSFHRYLMRQAIEEGYIINPLSGYMPYSTAYRLEEEYTPDKLVDEQAAEEGARLPEPLRHDQATKARPQRLRVVVQQPADPLHPRIPEPEGIHRTGTRPLRTCPTHRCQSTCVPSSRASP